MSRDPAPRTAPAGLAPHLSSLAGPLVLLAAIVAGLALFQWLLAPPRRDLVDLALYLVATGVLSMTAGWAAFGLAERRLHLSIRSKAALTGVVGSTVALVNVFVVARLMFVSTTHDLPLLATLLVFSGVLGAFFSLRLATLLSDRLERVSRVIRALSEGRLGERLDPEGGDEVALLAADVDRLAWRLAEADRDRRRLDLERRELSAALSHDLRTPLASVRAMVEALGDRVVSDPAETDRYLRSMRHELDRLSEMLDDLFELARIDAHALQLHRRPLLLQDVAAEVVDAMGAQARAQDATVVLKVTGNPPAIEIDGERVERALANLVRNAIEYGPRGGTIEVHVEARGSGAAVSVTDEGDGLPPEELERVWERFYRGERARTRSARAPGGTGLGLAIVRGITEAHGGSVEAVSTVGRGAAFTMYLPGAPTQASSEHARPGDADLDRSGVAPATGGER